MLHHQELSAPVLLAYVAVDENKMADYASRLYNTLLKGIPDLVPFGKKYEARRNVLDLK